MSPSRFLNEISPEYVTSFHRTQPLPPETSWSVGKAVYHRDFGSGVIRKCYETSLGPTYDVFFDQDQETRSLVVKYAKLTALET